MRLAENKDRFTEKEISNVANSMANGKLSLRAANALLPKQQPRGNTSKETDDDDAKGGEAIAKQYLKEVWEPDELVIVLQEVRDTEYLKKLHVEVGTRTFSPLLRHIFAVRSAISRPVSSLSAAINTLRTPDGSTSSLVCDQAPRAARGPGVDAEGEVRPRLLSHFHPDPSATFPNCQTAGSHVRALPVPCRHSQRSASIFH